MSKARGATGMNQDGKRHRGTLAFKHDLPKCLKNGKPSYSSKAKAMKAIGRAYGTTTYKCQFCPYWHRTTKRSGSDVKRKQYG